MKQKPKPGIGAKLRKLRKSKGVSAKFVAMTIDISPQFLCDLEKDRRKWPVHLIEAYTSAVNG